MPYYIGAGCLADFSGRALMAVADSGPGDHSVAEGRGKFNLRSLTCPADRGRNVWIANQGVLRTRWFTMTTTF